MLGSCLARASVSLRRCAGVSSLLGRRFASALGRLATALAETHRLGQFRPCSGVVRRHHRIVFRQAPLGPIVLRREAVLVEQVALHRLKGLAVFQADDVVRRDARADRHRRRLRFGLGRRNLRRPRQRAMHARDQARQGVGAIALFDTKAETMSAVMPIRSVSALSSSMHSGPGGGGIIAAQPHTSPHAWKPDAMKDRGFPTSVDLRDASPRQDGHAVRSARLYVVPTCALLGD